MNLAILNNNKNNLFQEANNRRVLPSFSSQKLPNSQNFLPVNKKTSFKGNFLNPFLKFIALKESPNGLSVGTFIADTTTNAGSKTVTTRSLKDWSESMLLEFGESALFYFAPVLLGESLFRPVLTYIAEKSGGMTKDSSKYLVESSLNLAKNTKLKNSGTLGKILPVKAAIVLACVCIPAAEYSLSFVKNLFTLKVFKTADFTKIANLNKNKKNFKDDKEILKHNKKVEKGAYSHIKGAAIISAVGIGASTLMAAFGHKSKSLQKISEYILHPGSKLYSGLRKIGLKDSPKFKKILEKYISLDFGKNVVNKNGKASHRLALSKGLMTASIISGVAGYLAAAYDRGTKKEKLDFWETMTRVPFVVAPYLIFGNDLLEYGWNKFLYKFFPEKFKHIITKNIKTGELQVAKVNQLHEIAKNIAKTSNGTKIAGTVENELRKSKAIVSGAPYIFGIGIMGLALSLISRFWTQYRYNHGVGRENQQNSNFSHLNTSFSKNIKNIQNINPNPFKKFSSV